MTQAKLEHANFTVSNAEKSALLLCDLFGWHIRWKGASIHDGYSIHVGEEDSYLALYQPPKSQPHSRDNYTRVGGLNHIAVVVTDLDATEERVKAAGLVPDSHADYEPGRRFYFHDSDGIEYEIVQYD